MARLGVWNSGLMVDTVAWLVVSGLATLFSTLKAAKEDGFFRRPVVSAVGLGAVMQFVLNLHTFNLVVELLLVPLLTFFLLMSTVAHMRPDTVKVGVFSTRLALVGLWIVVATARALLNSWRGLDPRQTGIEFAFSIWFLLAMIPFVYVTVLAEIDAHACATLRENRRTRNVLEKDIRAIKGKDHRGTDRDVWHEPEDRHAASLRFDEHRAVHVAVRRLVAASYGITDDAVDLHHVDGLGRSRDASQDGPW